MNHFHNVKLIATIWPSIDKETILAKIINNIDVFRINLSHGDEDTKKKYIDMVVKLDSSKSIMLDTKGPEIRTRNKEEMTLKKNQEISIAYAEFFKHEENTLFIDYPNIHNITPGSIMSIDNDAVSIEILENRQDKLLGKVKHKWVVLINRWVEFENYIPKLSFLSEKDKKHIVWWAENKANVVAISYIRNKENVDMIKAFLKDINWSHLKIVAKVETKDTIENIEEIIQHVDGISINKTKLSIIVGEEEVDKVKKHIISLCNKSWKPVLVNTWMNIKAKNNKADIERIKSDMKAWVDAFILTKETAISENPIDLVTMLYEITNDPENTADTEYTLNDICLHDERTITDYIIYNAYRISKELNIKAIICPTESGYTPARLSSLKPSVPIISFTKNDDAYRYINLLRWVKWYKISSTFDYTNIKQIGKEIIRILFKGNISLDDKILIVHSSLEQNTPHMINGIELYKFKDI